MKLFQAMPPPRLWRVPLRGLGDTEGGPSQLRALDIFPFLERLAPLVAAACLLGSLWQMPEAPLTPTMQSTAAVEGLSGKGSSEIGGYLQASSGGGQSFPFAVVPLPSTHPWGGGGNVGTRGTCPLPQPQQQQQRGGLGGRCRDVSRGCRLGDEFWRGGASWSPVMPTAVPGRWVCGLELGQQ